MRKPKKSPLVPLVRLAVLAVTIYAAYTIVSIQGQVSAKRAEVAGLEQERVLREQQIARLNDELESPLDETAIARLAREKLGLVGPRERVFIDIGR
jgi:cell division protein FtsB